MGCIADKIRADLPKQQWFLDKIKNEYPTSKAYADGKSIDEFQANYINWYIAETESGGANALKWYADQCAAEASGGGVPANNGNGTGTQEAPPPDEEKKPFYKTTGGMIAIGVGVLVLGGLLYYGMSSPAEKNKIKKSLGLGGTRKRRRRKKSMNGTTLPEDKSDLGRLKKRKKKRA